MKRKINDWFRVSWRDTGVSLAILLGAVALCAVLLRLDPSGGYASMVFVLAVICIARFTAGYLYGIFASFVGVVCTNYIFTYPYWSLDFTVAGYPLTCDSAGIRAAQVKMQRGLYYSSACVTTHEDAEMDRAGNLILGDKNPCLSYSNWGWSIAPFRPALAAE